MWRALLWALPTPQTILSVRLDQYEKMNKPNLP